MYFCLLTAMTRSSAARDLLPMILDGRAKAAASLALSTLETMATRQGEAAVELSSLSADLMLAQDCAEDAEDLLQTALTRISRLVSLVLAEKVFAELRELGWLPADASLPRMGERMILHAGPPIPWQRMCWEPIEGGNMPVMIVDRQEFKKK